ncbi:DEAD/DEAH box helicase [Planctomicrobium sp. SH661]|uniref:DEAD/DEAH box helicase n=1 Tax=Planctomicrobium sp. SH661 TaxID=3448124 RepID=UPI003F5AF546
MAKNLTTPQLRDALRSLKQSGHDRFAILKAISALVNVDDGSDTAREMVLRALDQQHFFEPYQEILDALSRAVGLFPYIDPESLGLKDSIAYEFHRPLNMPSDLVFHREQAKIYQRLLAGDSVVLSAPTSFGKSKIIDAMIASGRYSNIAIIVPTLALIDETRRRLAVFSKEYKVVTHLTQLPAAKNIFVFTAERAVAYEQLPQVDFFVIDEFYKLDPGDRDDSRAVALSQTFYKLRKGGAQFYLLGPNIDRVPTNVEGEYGCYFYQTRFGTVVSEQTRVDNGRDEMERLTNLASELEGPTLIFCSSPPRVNAVARTFLDRGLGLAAR